MTAKNLTRKQMVFRINEIEVPDESPFRNDALGREEIVQLLANTIGRTSGPFVLALDAPWGSGKTTFIRMLQVVLRKQNFQCVYFNAWTSDYVVDPLVPMVATVDQIELAVPDAATAFRNHLRSIRQVTTLVAKRGGVAAVKALTLGVLNVEDEIEAVAAEFASEAASDVVELYQKESALLAKFRSDLEQAVSQLPAAGKQPNLIFFIDELDRCRPTFAIELLERVKHLFDVPNIIFVLSIDKTQLEASTAAVYGSGINAPEYLRRFIDLEYGLPPARGVSFTNLLMKTTQLDEVFAARVGELAYDREHFVNFFSHLADLCGLPLRARERCITRLKVVMDQTLNSQYLIPILVSVLIVLRTVQPKLYERFTVGDASPDDVMEYLRGFSGFEKIAKDRIAAVLEAEIQASDKNEARRNAKQQQLSQIAQDPKASDEDRRYASDVVDMMSHLRRPLLGGLNIQWIAKKIDLASRIQDR